MSSRIVNSETLTRACTDTGCLSARHPGHPKCLPHLHAQRRANSRAHRARLKVSRPARIPNSQRQCRLDECSLVVWAKDLCRKHYKTHAVRPPCTFPGCLRSMHARDLCTIHYEAARTRGELPVIQPQGVLTPQERFAQYVDITPTCHLWTGTQDPNGRGHFTVTSVSAPAPRVAYEFANGPIPTDEDGSVLPLDHGCLRPPCVRVEHLEPVTNLENMRRRGVASGQRDITQADGWLFGLAIPLWQKEGIDNFPARVVTTL